MEETITVSDSLWVVVSSVSLEYDGLFTIRDDGGSEVLVGREEIPTLIEVLQKIADRHKTVTDREKRFVACHQELHAKAQEAAEMRKSLIELHVALHYPGVPYKTTIMEDNLLSIDLVFPGMGRDLSQRIVDEVKAYLEDLLKSNVN